MIDNYIQKGFVNGVAGCIEHTTLTHETFQNAKKHQRSICASWVDLKNAYGTIRHMQLQYALKRYHVPKEICKLIFNYYEGLFGKVVTKDWSSSWFSFEIGLFQDAQRQRLILTSLFNHF